MMLTLDEVLQQAGRKRVIPLIEKLFSGSETPLSVFEKLAVDKPGSFLLESAEHGVWARYSFVGVSARGFLSKQLDGKALWRSEKGASALPNGTSDLPETALGALRTLHEAWNAGSSADDADLPPLTNGLVGLLGWDVIREIENLPNPPASDFPAPLMGMSLFEDLVILDHKTNSLLLVANIFVEDGADIPSLYRAALARLDEMRAGIAQPSPVFLAKLNLATELEKSSRTPRVDFLEAVEQAKGFVRIGDVFQVVLSQRFDVELSASPLDVYRVLRSLNPSPYMYLLNFEDETGAYAVVGASPESLVQVKQGHVVTHPIAGSRPRGSNLDQDDELTQSLVADAKERAEHLMLVDLARNDLLKVCQSDSVAVTEFMQVHKYSHIMHLVSTVEGELRADQSAIDAFTATFPAGTLSGAPKPRALEIIDQLETSNRGIYGGVVGYFDFAGNADLAISIRTAYLRDGVAHIQAGAGIVLDSVPESEYEETISKASASMRAVAAANTLEKVN
ncbi:MAG: chorismate-binding protein [Actinomycetales bacterium]|nr:chorismate-binding protein [Actinomycetales bacterium]